MVVKFSIKKIQVAGITALSLLASLLTFITPAQAYSANGLVFRHEANLEPGGLLRVQTNGWQPANVAFDWYRCDSPVTEVHASATPVSVPSDCSVIPGVTGSSYTISSLVDNNPDEGKYITAVATSDEPQYAMAESTSNFVIVNRHGGTNSGDGMRMIMSNGSFQIYRNNVPQIYPEAYGGSATSMPYVAAENGLIIPADQTDSTREGWMSNVALTNFYRWDSNETQLLVDDASGLYVAQTAFSKTFPGGKTYTLTQTLTYRFPNQIADVTFSLDVPTGASSPVHLYYGIDMFLDGNDYGPGRSILFGPNRLVAQQNGTAVGGILETEGSRFTSWVEAFYYCPFGRAEAGKCGNYGPGGIDAGNYSYPNTVDQTNTDSGVGAHWSLGSAAGTYERSFKLYFGPLASAVSLTYSRSETKPNSQVVTYVNLSNFAGYKMDRVSFEIELPDATYGTVTSTCAGTGVIDRSGSAPHLIFTEGKLPSASAVCQLIIPTTFATEGVRTVGAANLVSGAYYQNDDVENTTPLVSMIGDWISVSANASDSPSSQLTSNTTASTDIGKTTATLNGTGSANGLPGFASFCYSTNANLSNCTMVSANTQLSVGDPASSFSFALTGLTAGTRYYYRAVVSNGITVSNGPIQSFTTAACFEAITGNLAAREHRIMFTGDCEWTAPSGVTSVQVLVVAGGGGGGAACVGGGGGAGGAIEQSEFAVSGTVSVRVGAGGLGALFAPGCQGPQAGNGGDSSFGTLTATGGGGGGNYYTFLNGAVGGSGGGGGGVSGLGGAGTTGQGFAGGDGNATAGNPGGGGGGATGAGGIPADGIGGRGGAGLTSSITGVATVYAAGGGGASDFTGAAGGDACAGTGASGETPATDATGYGCGGGGGDGHNRAGNGSAGVVIIRYFDPVVTPPVVSGPKTKLVRGFAFESPKLPSSAKSEVRAFLNANPSLNKITCTGYTGYNWFKRSASFLKKLARDRADAVCTYAKTVRPSLKVVKLITVNQKSKQESVRRVLIKLTK